MMLIRGHLFIYLFFIIDVGVFVFAGVSGSSWVSVLFLFYLCLFLCARKKINKFKTKLLRLEGTTKLKKLGNNWKTRAMLSMTERRSRRQEGERERSRKENGRERRRKERLCSMTGDKWQERGFGEMGCADAVETRC